MFLTFNFRSSANVCLRVCVTILVLILFVRCTHTYPFCPSCVVLASGLYYWNFSLPDVSVCLCVKVFREAVSSVFVCVCVCVIVSVCVCPFLYLLLVLSSFVRGLLLLAEQHQIVGHDVAHVQIDDPVHQVEADKTDRKYDARVLVDIRGRNS